jgi:ABC-2 type transport system ATP-binding protein
VGKRLIGLSMATVLLGSILSPAFAKEPTIEDNIIVKSFDDTPIVTTLMLPDGASEANPVPVVLMTHGWGGKRTRTADDGTLLKRLLDNGYAIFTWDSRGFGESGGEANVDSPEFEVKDAIALIDYLATRKEIQKDGPGDIRAGWMGGSYAGGIQLNTSGFDHRVDALIPEIPWANLLRDLYPNGVLKRNWDQLLYGAGVAAASSDGAQSPAGPQTGNYNEHIHQSEAQGTATQTFDEELQDWFYKKSTILNSPNVTVPTMIMQGTIDTLFPLEDVYDNYALMHNNVPLKIVTFCGGHTLEGCAYPGAETGDPKGDRKGSYYDDLKFNWLEHYVKEKEAVNVGPVIEWQAQDGWYRSAKTFPLPGTHNHVSKARTVSLTGPGNTGGDQPSAGGPAGDNEIGSTAARVLVMGKRKHARALVGVPRVKVTGSMTAAQFGYVFFELVDRAPDGTLTTVDVQTMPYRFESGDIEKTVSLHGISWLLKPNHKLKLEMTTGSAQYDLVRTGPYTVDLKPTTTLQTTRKVGRISSR